MRGVGFGQRLFAILFRGCEKMAVFCGFLASRQSQRWGLAVDFQSLAAGNRPDSRESGHDSPAAKARKSSSFGVNCGL